MSSITSIQQRSAWSGLEALAARAQRTSAGSNGTSSAEEMFAAADSDGDGTLSRTEFDAALQASQPQSFDMSAMSTQAFAGGGMPPPPPPGEGGQDPIASLDTDGDGAVSADEFGLDSASDPVKQLFAAIDTDGDGALSTDETDAFREKFTQAMGGAHRPPPGPPPTDASGTASAGATGASSAVSETADATSAAAATGTTASSADDELRGFLQQLSELFVRRYAEIASAGEQATQAVSVSA